MPLAASSFSGLTHLGSGKVREMFAVDGPDGEPAILLVASDRISAYDVILPTEIPDKGAVLTALSLWWFDQLADLVPSHLLTARVAEYPDSLQPYADQLRGRSMLCRRLDMFPVECVARGYLTGSGLKDYQRTGAVSGHQLPAGLVDGDQLPEPIYTPSTKAPQGEHDENITRDDVVATLGREQAEELERLTLGIFRRATQMAGGARHPAGRHQVRVRPGPERDAAAGRRGAHPRLVPLLAGRRLAARAAPSRPTTSSTSATG